MAGGPKGGAEAFFERLTIALAAAGVEQHTSIRRNALRAERLNAAGIEVSEARFGGPLDFLTPRRLYRDARLFQPDITFAWMSRAASMAPKRPGVLAARLGSNYNLKYYRRCEHLVGIGRGICDYLIRQGWPAERVHYLPNFVDAEPMPPEPRAAHDTPEDAQLILALGRFHRNKGFDVLLAALAQVPDAVLWLAGAGPEEAELKRLADTNGVADRVRWLGWRDDVAALYAAADVFVCSSRTEGFGSVMIEAWAHGAPVVAADAAGPAQLLGETPEAGILVPIEKAEPLAAALRDALAEPQRRAAMAEAGRSAFAAQFTEEAVVQHYLDFFERIKR